MTQPEAAGILLVRSVEESRPEALPPDVLIDALSAAGDIASEPAWLSRRAAFLLGNSLVSYRPVLAIAQAPLRGVAALVAAAFLVGLMSNYLGPSAKIHVLFNPIALLIVWNLAVYAALGLHPAIRHVVRIRKRRDPTHHRAGSMTAALPALPGDLRPDAPRTGLLTRLLLGRLVPAVWLRLHRAADEGVERASDVSRVARAFWRHWIGVARPSLLLAFRRALHCAAIGIGIGAVLGMYARGMFFEYNVVWRSTFVTESNVVLAAVRWALGPAALLLGQPLPDQAQVALLTSQDGAPAAPWIHLYAASAIIFVVVPRALLALQASLRIRSMARSVTLDLHDAYYREMLASARRLQVQRVAERINTDVRVECAKFSEGLATFVCERLYDGRITPRIRRFREEGGRLTDLEESIRGECQTFKEELARHIPVAQDDFERSLARSIERTIGASLSVEAMPAGGLRRLGALSEAPTRVMGNSIGAGLADIVSGGVAAAVAVVAGTVSGGFGETVGLAILVELGVAGGPVGWIIGAVAALFVAGAGWWLGRDKLTGSIKQVRLPARVVKAVLWKGKLEKIIADGRTKCHTSVKVLMDEELSPLTPKIAEQIWMRVKPVLGETQKLREHGNRGEIGRE